MSFYCSTRFLLSFILTAGISFSGFDFRFYSFQKSNSFVFANMQTYVEAFVYHQEPVEPHWLVDCSSQLLRSRVQFFSRVCRSRLGGPCRQPRQSFLRGPRQPDHNLAETKQHVSPRNPPFRIHPADGAAQQKVRLQQK